MPDDAPAQLSGLRLTVLVGESDQYRHRPLYAEIVHRAHRAGLAGASVFRGIEGFGASSVVHTQRLLSLSEDLPVLVVIVDRAEKVREFLPQLRDVLPDGTAVLDPCEIVRLSEERGEGADPHDSPGPGSGLGPRPGADPDLDPGTEA
ncbi:DUF190 domain-containing protein [Streptomyces sp. NA04227]|uniref:DUF190 domain-containing protein n=1 Tax=Streptomyces sp. NA04227 TaxID=2742136 RepID=UPI0020CA687B|nr:DUF190 domain-containing protein [Streptomyces sp. NA04227]